MTEEDIFIVDVSLKFVPLINHTFPLVVVLSQLPRVEPIFSPKFINPSALNFAPTTPQKQPFPSDRMSHPVH